MIYKYTKIGAFHKERGAENEDAVRSASGSRYTVIALADGVSSCARAKEGAAAAADAVTSLYAENGAVFFGSDTQSLKRITMSHAVYHVKEKAKQIGCDVADCSSTLSSAVYDRKKNKILYFNVGDAVILGVKKDSLRVLAQPYASDADGTCVLTTEGAQAAADGKVIDADGYNAIMICSDGAWKKMYRFGYPKAEVRSFLVKNDFKKLNSYLAQQENEDDCSYIAFTTRHRKN